MIVFFLSTWPTYRPFLKLLFLLVTTFVFNFCTYCSRGVKQSFLGYENVIGNNKERTRRAIGVLQRYDEKKEDSK